MSGRMTLNVDCRGHRCNVAGKDFNMNIKSCCSATQTLRADSKFIYSFQQFQFHISVKGVGIPVANVPQ